MPTLYSLLLWVWGHRPSCHMRAHTPNRTRPGRVWDARAHDLRTRIQLRSAGSMTCYILDHTFTSELCNMGMRTREFRLLYNTRSNFWWRILGVTTGPRVVSETWRMDSEQQLDLGNDATTEWSQSDWEWYDATTDYELGAMQTQDLPQRSKLGTTHREHILKRGQTWS